MAKKKTTKSKSSVLLGRKGAWYVPLRGSYIPCSWQGWLTYVPFVVYLLLAYMIGIQIHSLAWAIIIIGTNWFAATAVMTWAAKHTS